MYFIQKREIEKRLPSKPNQEPETRNQKKSIRIYEKTVKMKTKQKKWKTINFFVFFTYNGKKKISRR